MQVILLLAALAAVPVMLIPKPLVLRKRAQARAAQVESYGRVSPQDPEEGEEEHPAMHIASASHHEEEFDFGEVAVHQVRPTLPDALLQICKPHLLQRSEHAQLRSAGAYVAGHAASDRLQSGHKHAIPELAADLGHAMLHIVPAGRRHWHCQGWDV